MRVRVRESPAFSDAGMAERAGLWDAAGPHIKNTAAPRAINGTRPQRKSGPEAPGGRGPLPQFERQQSRPG